MLNQWENNPILIELIKIVKRIESFDLNDSLMKYLTGVELLVEKAQSWQLVESKMTSIESETKQLSLIIVEWRKYELNFWQKSLDLELLKVRNRTAYNWFNHIFAICSEYSKNQVDDFEFLMTLKQFIEFSLNGDYSIRLKQLKLCYDIFKNDPNNKVLTDTLWNVYNYYSVLYSPLLLDDLNAHKQTIEKELKDFIDICRWQDMNYWALKQSVTKYNKGLFKIIKKFRQYLNQKIDLSKSSSQTLANSNLTLSKKDLNQLVHIDELNDDKYFNKMKIICKKSLHLKCSKYNFNRSLAEFTAETY